MPHASFHWKFYIPKRASNHRALLWKVTCKDQASCEFCLMPVSTENATSPKSTKSRNSDSSVSHRTNSNWDFVVIWIRTDKFEFLDLVDFGDVSFSVETIIRCRPLSAKEPLIIGLFCGKWPIKSHEFSWNHHHITEASTQDALSHRSLSAKEPIILWLFCGKWFVKSH